MFLYLLLGYKRRAWGMQDSHIFQDEFCHSCPEDRDTLASALRAPPKPGSCLWLPRAGRDGRRRAQAPVAAIPTSPHTGFITSSALITPLPLARRAGHNPALRRRVSRPCPGGRVAVPHPCSRKPLHPHPSFGSGGLHPAGPPPRASVNIGNLLPVGGEAIATPIALTSSSQLHRQPPSAAPSP